MTKVQPFAHLLSHTQDDETSMDMRVTYWLYVVTHEMTAESEVRQRCVFAGIRFAESAWVVQWNVPVRTVRTLAHAKHRTAR